MWLLKVTLSYTCIDALKAPKNRILWRLVNFVFEALQSIGPLILLYFRLIEQLWMPNCPWISKYVFKEFCILFFWFGSWSTQFCWSLFHWRLGSFSNKSFTYIKKEEGILGSNGYFSNLDKKKKVLETLIFRTFL